MVAGCALHPSIRTWSAARWASLVIIDVPKVQVSVYPYAISGGNDRHCLPL